MGLKEKRFTKEFQEEQFPTLKQKIDAAVGFDIPIDVQWDTLFEDRFLHLYSDSYPKIYFQPLIEAFTVIASDEMGKEAIQESLQKIVIVNRDNHHNPTHAYTFIDGVLEVNHSPILNADNVSERTEVLTHLLESKL